MEFARFCPGPIVEIVEDLFFSLALMKSYAVGYR
jgi:hypothetical protein